MDWRDWQDWLDWKDEQYWQSAGWADFGYPKLPFESSGGSILVPWDAIWMVQGFLGHPMGRFGFQTWIFIDLGWILGPSRGSLGDPWDDLVVNRGAQMVENERKVAAQDGAITKTVIRLLPRWPNVAPIV